ncbi:36.4 kDa proline-rich protein-like [Salvia hispanica]|uniref:36.4 kDa proline-rich protein-like n=1 Tax=Salvia hispanica TaxID=49212 RepID=UPI00200904D0|nr:36.4 kDa proline-rich protein-like [Salvia hispanica]
MGSKTLAMVYVCMLFMLISLPPTHSCPQHCGPPYPPYGGRPSLPGHHHPHPPFPPKHHPLPPSPPKHHPSPPRPPAIVPPIIMPPPVITPPIINPPGIIPPIINPPVTKPPPSSSYPPYTPPPPRATCPIDALKLGLCLDVLGGLVHVGIGNPAENVCCPVLQGLLELEAAVCLCTTIRLKLLNLNIFLPLALQLLATCGLTPPPGFMCPPL